MTFQTGIGGTRNIIFGTNSATIGTNERMRIDGVTGKIGVGTSSPASIFNVAGSGDGTTLLMLQKTDSFISGNSGIKLAFANSSQNIETAIHTRASGTGIFDLAFETTTSSTLSEVMRLSGTGLVGIGNTTPVAKLDVSGAITGKALAMFNETGNQALLTASASGVAKFTIQHNGLTDASANGVATNVAAGAISDSTYGSDTPVNGLLGVDSADGRLYFRYSGAWHYVAQTAGFQIPNYETFAYDFDTKSFDTNTPLKDGDFLLPFAEKRMSDGAIHGLYAKLSDVADRVFKAVELVVKRLRTGKITITDDTVGSGLISKDTTEIEIQNSNINSDSLIYITPTSPTQNKVLYIKEKKDGSFKVGLSDSISEDINFNWWIIEKGK